MNTIENLNIVFMGTPEFAVPSLKGVVDYDCNLLFVVTQPDRPKGRGRKLAFSPVKKTALQLGIDVVQPVSVKDPEFESLLVNAGADLFIVAAFGQILPKKILEIPRFGAINLHASLLPKYRGASPIQWAILNGEKETGVTSMLMDKGLDTGEILVMKKTPIFPDDTAATLHDRLSILARDVLFETLDLLKKGELRPVAQDHSKATYAPLLRKSDGHIDWTRPAEYLERFVRAMNPWPGAFTFHNDRRFTIYKSAIEPIKTTEPPGTVVRSFPGELVVATGDQGLKILEIQAASSKRMSIEEFLRGNSLPPGTRLK